MVFDLTEDELNLIEAIRNVRNAYPNGYKELLWYAQECFDELVDVQNVDNVDQPTGTSNS